MPSSSPTRKRFIAANELLFDSFRLGRQVFDSGWRPDVLIALWRGGTPVGVAVHEILDRLGVPTRHMAVKCQSYTGIDRRGPVRIENAATLLATVRPGHRVLVVDDILDSGRTARAVLRLLTPRAAETRLAVIYWKLRASATGLRPDYHMHKTGVWIVFPHELTGLSPAEIRRKDPALRALVRGRLAPAGAAIPHCAARRSRARR